MDSARSGKGIKLLPSIHILKRPIRSAAFHLHNITKIGSILSANDAVKAAQASAAVGPIVTHFYQDVHKVL